MVKSLFIPTLGVLLGLFCWRQLDTSIGITIYVMLMAGLAISPFFSREPREQLPDTAGESEAFFADLEKRLESMPTPIFYDVETTPDGTLFTVPDAIDWGPMVIGDSPLRLVSVWERKAAERLKLACRAVPGAMIGKPVTVDWTSVTGLQEDLVQGLEYRIAPTLANVTALSACRYLWNDAAKELAKQFEIFQQTIDEVGRKMEELADADFRRQLRSRELQDAWQERFAAKDEQSMKAITEEMKALFHEDFLIDEAYSSGQRP